MTFVAYKSSNESAGPFPIEGASSALVHFAHYQKSSYKIYSYGGLGRFGATPDANELFELNIPNNGGASASGVNPPTWKTIVTEAATEEMEDFHVPDPRTRHTLTLSPLVNKLYLYGGELGQTGVKHNDPHIYELDLNNGKFVWTQLATCSESINRKTKVHVKPLQRCMHATCAATVGHPFIYVYGGFNSVLKVTLGDLWQFNIVKKSWKLLYTPQMVKKVVEQEDQNQNLELDTELVFDPSSVKKIAPCPIPRYGHCMCMGSRSDALYVIGGCDNSDTPFKEIWKFDLKKMQWELQGFDCSDDNDDSDDDNDDEGDKQSIEKQHNKTIIRERKKSSLLLDTLKSRATASVSKNDIINYHIPFYIPGRGAAAIMFGDCIVIQGGETLMEEVEPILKDILVYDTNSKRLLKIDVGNSNTALMGHSMVLHNDRLILLGGKYSWPYYNYSMFMLPLLEHPELKQLLVNKKNRVSGVSLNDLLKRETKPGVIPTLYSKLIDYLMQKGLDEEGIFRLSSSSQDVSALRLRFEQGIPAEYVDLSQYKNVHAVAAFLKQLLRELPIPLFTYEAFDKVLAVFELDPKKETNVALRELKSILSDQKLMPPVHKALVLVLLNLFKSIVEHSNMSKMTADALARCTTYSLLSTKTREKEQKLLMVQENPLIKAVAIMIENVDTLAK